MKLLTPLQAYELEEKSIRELPISSAQLMENAGESIDIPVGNSNMLILLLHLQLSK